MLMNKINLLVLLIVILINNCLAKIPCDITVVSISENKDGFVIKGIFNSTKDTLLILSYNKSCKRKCREERQDSILVGNKYIFYLEQIKVSLSNQTYEHFNVVMGEELIWYYGRDLIGNLPYRLFFSNGLCIYNKRQW